MTTTDTRPDDLRNSMVDHIENAGHLHSGRVEQALRTVPRHEFVPEASAEAPTPTRPSPSSPAATAGPRAAHPYPPSWR